MPALILTLDKNCVERCENVVKTIKNSVRKKKRKHDQVSTAVPTTPPATAITTTTTTASTTTTTSPSTTPVTATDKIKPQIDDHTKFLRQFLKKSFSITDMQLKPYRTDEYIHKLFYESARFSAFNHQWVVKAIINNR